MKFKNYINELFDTNIKVNYTKRSKDFYDFRFVIDGKEYQSEIYKISFIDEDVWTITFFDYEGGEEVTGRAGSNVFKIFSGVMKCVEIVMKKEKPEEIFFTAEEPSRIKLYDKFAKLFVKKTGYKLETNKGNNQKKYTFLKDK